MEFKGTFTGKPHDLNGKIDGFRWRFFGSLSSVAIVKQKMCLSAIVSPVCWDGIQKTYRNKTKLVGFLEYFLMTFPSYWECNHPNWRFVIFFRGVGQPPTRKHLTFLWFHHKLVQGKPLCFYTSSLPEGVPIRGTQVPRSSNAAGAQWLFALRIFHQITVPQRCFCQSGRGDAKLPSGELTKSNRKWPFIGDFPIKNGDFPLLC